MGHSNRLLWPTPQINVLVMDFTELGDVSKLLFGGVASADLTSTGQVRSSLLARISFVQEHHPHCLVFRRCDYSIMKCTSYA
jgi:hypothetical protein